MKLLPFGLMLPVHYCCEPSKRLGWVPVRTHHEGPVFFLVGHRTADLYTGRITEPGRLYTTIERLQLEGNGAMILAVKSAHEPVETWRKITGFIEDRG